MTRIELHNKLDGHNRVGESLRKRAYKNGKGSKEWTLYMHHVSEWVRINAILKGGS